MASSPDAACRHCPAERTTGCLSAAQVAVVACAPLLLALAWTTAALVQARPYDWTAQTISVLAGRGATHSWIMAAGLLLAGGTYLGLAVQLRVLTARSRAVLAAAGTGVVVAALAPQPVQGSSPVHMGAAACAWVALTAWPLTANLHTAARPLPRFRVAVTGVLLVQLAWFFLQLIDGGALLGAVERLLMLSQMAYPTYVARHLRRAQGPPPAARPGMGP
jgi:hypothetical protein